MIEMPTAKIGRSSRVNLPLPSLAMPARSKILLQEQRLNVERVINQIRHNTVIDAALREILIAVLCEQHYISDALSIAKKMQKENIWLGSRLFTTLISYHGKIHRSDVVREILMLMVMENKRASFIKYQMRNASLAYFVPKSSHPNGNSSMPSPDLDSLLPIDYITVGPDLAAYFETYVSIRKHIEHRKRQNKNGLSVAQIKRFSKDVYDLLSRMQNSQISPDIDMLKGILVIADLLDHVKMACRIWGLALALGNLSEVYASTLLCCL
jgi:hypothetical protein